MIRGMSWPPFFFLAVIWLLGGCPRQVKIQEPSPRGVIRYAGVRSSIYGIRPFPAEEGWRKAIAGVRDRLEPRAEPCAIWIVGTSGSALSCHLEFPDSGVSYDRIEFSSKDRHEAYLSHFDARGIKVFLQVEPMSADVPTLIDLVLGRYRRHPCVVGFGIDVEWHREAEKPEWGMPVDDVTAQVWEARVKSHDPAYRLFLKHWDREWMPPHYRGDIVFISDSQELESLEKMCEEFSGYWAPRFAPNPVFFQVGYASDRAWWSKLSDPPREIARAIAPRIPQPCGFFWVDFTLRELFPQI